MVVNMLMEISRRMKIRVKRVRISVIIFVEILA